MNGTKFFLESTGIGSGDEYNALRSGTGDPRASTEQASRKSSNLSEGTGSTLGAIRFEPVSQRMRGVGQLDGSLLERAAEILDGIDHVDHQTMILAIESLKYVATELWASAAKASPYHQSILAAVDTLLRSNEGITDAQAVALRGAFKDLGQPKLSEQYVDVVISSLVDVGYNPLAPLSAMESSDGERGIESD